MALTYLGALILLAYAMGALDTFFLNLLPVTTTRTIPKRAEDFLPGQPVRYVPYHAAGDPNHRDCQNGFVSSVNPTTQTIFVRFSLGSTAEGCKPDQLI